jgi:tRNA modification GTPase
MLVLDLSEELQAEDKTLLERLAGRGPVLVGNKADLTRKLSGVDGLNEVSATTGSGIAELKSTLLGRVATGGPAAPESGSITSLRHVALLRETLEALENAQRAVGFGVPHEMLLLDLYAALRPVDTITGATTADDILNQIFSTFCIGK